jgi:hypothetical protein
MVLWKGAGSRCPMKVWWEKSGPDAPDAVAAAAAHITVAVSKKN